MKKFLLSLILITLSLPAWAEENKKESTFDRIIRTNTIRCGYFAWPPFLTKDPNTKELSGISYDIVESIGKTLDLKIEWTAEVGVADYIEGFQSNRFDALCVSTWPHPTRFKQSLPTTPLFYTSVYPVVRADENRLDKNYDVLKTNTLKLGVIEGDDTETMVKTLYPSAPRDALPNSADYSQLLMELLTKKADVVFLDKSVIHDFIKTNGNKIKIPKSNKPVFVYPEYLFVEKGDIQTKMMLDNAINLLKDRGDMDKFLKQSITSSTVIIPPLK